MTLIYSMQMAMLLAALFLLFIPFRSRHAALKNYLLVGLFTILFSIGIYQFTTDTNALRTWFADGREHYQLLEKFDALGGVDGAIIKVKEKLAANPEDKQGWIILGKLYLTKQDKKSADDAFLMAKSL
jgi:cytochrome c-type biogenesis protein CcmH/NrfG